MLITHAGGSPSHGPNTRWYYLGQALKEYGVDVEIVSSSFFHKYIAPPRVTGGCTTEYIDGLRYHWLRTYSYKKRGIGQIVNQFHFIAQLYRFSESLADLAPDIVVASSPPPFVIFPARRIAAKAGAPLVYEVRDLWPELLYQLGNFSRWHPYIVLNSLTERYAVKHADRIISVKPGDVDYFSEKYQIDRERCVYIANGFLPGGKAGQLPPELEDLRSRYKYLVGYVGAVSRAYGLEELVNLAAAFKHRDDVGFIVFGGGDRAQDIRSLAQESGLRNFHMLGMVKRSQVEGILSKFDVCYATWLDRDVHKYGISANKIYEYMYSAKPIFACYTAGYDPVEEAKCGITVARGETESQAKALTALLEDSEMRESMGRNGRDYFDKRHDFSVIARLLLTQLEGLTE